MLALKLEPLLCVPNPRESESTVLTEVECWHPLATANGSALSAMSRPDFFVFIRASVAIGGLGPSGIPLGTASGSHPTAFLAKKTRFCGLVSKSDVSSSVRIATEGKLP